MKIKAYSLIKLLIVLVIIGTITFFAMPNFMGIFNNAKSTEAQQNLKEIHTLQKFHFFSNSSYSSDFNALNFIPLKTTIEGGTENYTYEIIEASKTSFKARATALNDSNGNGTKSTWEIDQEGKLIEVIKD